ncbi:hypothetical protein SAMN02910298_02382 [Pseudobutyrivibrio sp. YE44]|uniref:hypothetical protein n=1 Tax=Pseudobutyrivibrio sp. YE44 TaxID=1520802 RepID=UPI00088DF982|nr:hypothetical protein [Pseudobutyrivibrio sp. YE44]SDB47622.1 hypothetical protein SAMN02910298_02382 [Pseudobutyrivibrio sp. YE44]
MELTTLNKEYKLLREEVEEKFVKMSMIDANINLVEEYWITSDHTLGNATAYFSTYEMGIEYALDRVDYRMTLNADGQKPFIILVNGKAINTYGQLEAFLNGEFKIKADNVVESNVLRLYS